MTSSISTILSSRQNGLIQPIHASFHMQVLPRYSTSFQTKEMPQSRQNEAINQKTKTRTLLKTRPSTRQSFSHRPETIIRADLHLFNLTSETWPNSAVKGICHLPPAAGLFRLPTKLSKFITKWNHLNIQAQSKSNCNLINLSHLTIKND